MAEEHGTEAAKSPSRRGRYYTPAERIAAVPGVVRTESSYWCDEYRGTAQQLSDAGLLPLRLFPGQPGCNTVSATYRPSGVERLQGERIWQVPGALTVYRHPGDRYRLVLAVAREERQRRLDAEAARQREADAAEEEVMREIPARVREYLDAAIRQSGGTYWVRRWFHDAAWLERTGVTPRERRDVLNALDTCERARQERELVLRADFSAARAVIDRAGRARAHG